MHLRQYRLRLKDRRLGAGGFLMSQADLLAVPSMAVSYVSERCCMRSDCHPPPVGAGQAGCGDDLFGAQSVGERWQVWVPGVCEIAIPYSCDEVLDQSIPGVLYQRAGPR